MSLKESLLDLSGVMRDAAASSATDADTLRLMLLTASAELRGMSAALPDAPSYVPAHPEVDDYKLKARLAALEARRSAAVQEIGDGKMIEVVGGPGDDSSVQVLGEPPEGGYTSLAGERYQYRGGKLHYAPFPRG